MVRVLGSTAIMGAVHLLAVQGHARALLRRRLTRGARSVGVGALLASGSSLGDVSTKAGEAPLGVVVLLASGSSLGDAAIMAGDEEAMGVVGRWVPGVSPLGVEVSVAGDAGAMGVGGSWVTGA
jgi:hypothetical protein